MRIIEERVDWDRYQRWNGAIAEVVYTPERAGQPVYLDLEEDVLAKIVRRAEPEAVDATTALIEVVKATLDFRSGYAGVLRGHLGKLDAWYSGRMVDPPPCLALLAMLSIVAESMRQTQEMRAHNYYGRLGELLSLSSRQVTWFEQAYRHRRHREAASEELWGALNDWLEMLDGQRGTPTAFPVGHDHVGLPLSQALVRDADRQKFVDLFMTQGLPGGMTVPVTDMEVRIDEWMARNPCPASNTLEHMWKTQPSTRPAIAEVAMLALESWDGVGPDGTTPVAAARTIDTVKARAALLTFPTPRLDVSLVLPGHGTELEQVQVCDTEGRVLETIDVVPCASGWLGLANTAALDVESFLIGDVLLRRRDSAQLLVRRPRALVPLRYDAMLSAYIECERLQMGEEALVLVTVAIADRVDDFLQMVARPGYRRSDSLKGLPQGWVLFDHVQVLRAPPDGLKNQRLELNLLQPTSRSQVVLQGGLRLPGHLRKWHASRPPELRITLEDGEDIQAALICKRPMVSPPPSDLVNDQPGGVLIWDLRQATLPDGDYAITASAEGRVIASELLRLRSADNPAPSIRPDEPPIAHDPEAAGFGLMARPSSSPSSFTVAPSAPADLVTAPAPAQLPEWWRERRGERERAPVATVRFPTSNAPCVTSYAHHMDVETAMGQASVAGICRYCGLVKRYPTRPRRRKTAPSPHVAPPRLSLAEVPPVRAEDIIDWSVAFDAVCHVGSGPISALRRITDQMDATDLFGDAFARRLEVLGHIEVHRHPRTLQPIAWQVNEPTLVGLPGGGVVLTGFRSERLLVALEDSAWQVEYKVDTREQSDAPHVITVPALGPDDAAALAKVLSDAFGRPVRHIPDAANKLAAALKPLSVTATALPTSVVTAATTCEVWDPRTAHFQRTTDASGPGAFRLTANGRVYIFRSRKAEDGSARVGNGRIVKYLAAAESQRSLVGYAEEERILYVPLGADLPGLYGRTAVLASGRPPLDNPEEGILEYHRVPPALAAHLNHLLMS